MGRRAPALKTPRSPSPPPASALASTGVPLAQDSALIAGLDFALGQNATAGVSSSGQFGDGVPDNVVNGRQTSLL